MKIWLPVLLGAGIVSAVTNFAPTFKPWEQWQTTEENGQPLISRRLANGRTIEFPVASSAEKLLDQIASPPAKPAWINLTNAEFRSRGRLRRGSRDEIDRIAQVLVAHPGAVVEVWATGDDAAEANQRAESIRERLVDQGAAARQVIIAPPEREKVDATAAIRLRPAAKSG